MGIADLFTPEDKVNIKISQLCDLIKQGTQAEMLLNGVLNKVDHDSICKVVTGKSIDRYQEVIKEEG